MKHKLLYFVITILFFLSCGSKKKIIEIEKTDKISIEKITVDSISVKEKSLPIEDVFFVSLKTNNKVLDSIVEQKFQHFNTAKKSGTNSYSIKFDTVKKGLNILASIKGTSVLEIKSTKNIIKKDEVIKEKETVKETKTRLSWWFFVFVLVDFYFGFSGVCILYYSV